MAEPQSDTTQEEESNNTIFELEVVEIASISSTGCAAVLAVNPKRSGAATPAWQRRAEKKRNKMLKIRQRRANEASLRDNFGLYLKGNTLHGSSSRSRPRF